MENTIKVEDLRKRYGDREAFEWFVRAEDKRHWKLMKDHVKQKEKKMTALVAASAVASMAMTVICFQHCK